MAQKKKAEVELVFNSKGVVTGVRRANGELLKVRRTSERADRSMKKLRVSLVKLAGFAGIGGVSVALKSMASAIIRTGTEFEKSITRVGALAQATNSEMKILTKTARELGATTTFSANEAAEGMQFLAMAGFNTNQITQAMPGLLNQAAAGQITLAQAADITSNVLSGFSLKAAESGRVADVLTKASISSNTTIEGLGQAMAFVAPVASSLNLDLEELTAAVGILGNAGIQASRAGTALRGAILQLASPSKDQKRIQDELNFSIQRSDGSTRSLSEIISILTKGTEGMTDAQRTARLSILVGQEAVSGFTTLISAGSTALDEFTGKLVDSEGTAEEVAGRQINTLSGSIKLLTSALDELKITIFETFRNELRNTTDEATKNVGRLTTFFGTTLPAAMNKYRVISGRANAAILSFFGASDESINKWRSLESAGSDALNALINLQGELAKEGEKFKDDVISAPSRDSLERAKELADVNERITIAIRDRAIMTSGNEDLSVGFQFDAIPEDVPNELQQLAIEFGLVDLAMFGASATTQKLIADMLGLGDALSIVTEEGEKAVETTTKETTAQRRLGSQISSIGAIRVRTAKDGANAVAESVKRSILAHLGEAIAKMLATVPFPLNLIAGGGFAVALSALFDRLIPAFATGVTGFEGGAALVGERGPELVTLPGGSNVITNENTSAILRKVDSIGGAGSGMESAVSAQTEAITSKLDDVAERIERMQVQIDYFGLDDGLSRHRNQQALISG